MPKIWGYARSSTDAVELENQKRLLRAEGVQENDIYSDRSVSGYGKKEADRVQWVAVNRQLKEGDTLVVAALDRIGRRALETQRIILTLRERGVRIRTLATGQEEIIRPYLDCEPGSPDEAMGGVLVAFLTMFAQMERDAISRRIKAGLARVKAEGRRTGPPHKLTLAGREAMRGDRQKGMSWSKLAGKYGVSVSTAKNIVWHPELYGD